MTNHYKEFPFEEHRKENGDYFSSWKEVSEAGYDDDQIWSITEAEGVYSYGPPHHYINIVGFIATSERHNGNTYYHEDLEETFGLNPEEDDA